MKWKPYTHDREVIWGQSFFWIIFSWWCGLFSAILFWVTVFYFFVFLLEVCERKEISFPGISRVRNKILEQISWNLLIIKVKDYGKFNATSQSLFNFWKKSGFLICTVISARLTFPSSLPFCPSHTFTATAMHLRTEPLQPL